ncbi:MAG: MerC domain-containing protein [Planctomycetota bacterium]
MPANATPMTTPTGLASAEGRWDLVGIVASGACAVHCVATPFLLMFLPALGAAWSNAWVHWALAAVVLPLAFVVIGRGYRAHRRRSTLVLAGLGAAAIVAGLFLPAGDGLSFTWPGAASASSPPVLVVNTPSAATSGAVACTDTCCPSVAVDAATGATHVGLPWGSVATLAGGVLLVLAHGINLHGCLCATRTAAANADTACGCPANA